MPEGHTVHRHARELKRLFGGTPVRLSSPQGRFAAGASALDGCVLVRTEAWGKHLLLRFDLPPGSDRWLHVHLGLYGSWTTGHDEPPEPRGALRLRLLRESVTADGNGDDTVVAWADLRGPTACELLDDLATEAVRSRLGPDPLRPHSDPERAWQLLSRSRQGIGVLLMDQRVVAGVGNVYRAEALYRARLDPRKPGRELAHEQWLTLWADLVLLMRAGVRAGHIVTTERVDRGRRSGTALREDRFYVYRRHGLPCRRCGTDVQVAEVAGRNLFWCPTCQVG